MDNILEQVKEKWEQLTAFSKKEDIKDLLWDEIVYRYSEQHRHYHNLSHLAYLFQLCDQNLNSIKNPALVGFAIFYHDIVYDTYRQDNEEESAGIAKEHLQELSINPSLINSIVLLIRASKTHEVPADIATPDDLTLFFDLDMAILGAEADVYQRYCNNIRLEYAKYPDDVYKAGRKQALKQLLAREHIFITEKYRSELEEKARHNVTREMNLL